MMTIDVKKLISILNEIPINTYKVSDNTYVVEIKYEDNTYVGTSHCHPDDEEFKSEIVGFHIAYLRAVKKVLMHYRDLADNEYKIAKKLVIDICQGFEDDLDEVDPTGRLTDYYYRIAMRVAKYRVAIKQTQKTIHQYLRDQETAINSLRKAKELKAKED